VLANFITVKIKVVQKVQFYALLKFELIHVKSYNISVKILLQKTKCKKARYLLRKCIVYHEK